ncbi:MAG: T9SS type A sorting domain-containing protein [Bacteroidia bacterium]
MPNWSFEQHDSCPYAPGQIYFANGWFNVAFAPNYNNFCSSDSEYTVPTYIYNKYGYTDTTGIGDAQIATCNLCSFCENPPNQRETIGSLLITPLQIGKKYFVSFAVRLMISPGWLANSASNKIGALFSTVSYIMPIDSENDISSNYTHSISFIKNYSQVYTDSVVADTLNWTVISGSFIADSAYTYINIGDFFDDSLTNHILIYNDTSYAYEMEAWYLVDDVCVTDDSTASCASEWTGTNDIASRKNTMLIAPNPFSQNTTISFTFSDGYSIRSATISVFDMLGRKVRDGTVNLANDEYIFQKGNLSSGMYFIIIEINNRVFKQKIIIN